MVTVAICKVRKPQQICTITVAILYIYNVIYPLMWVVF